MKKYFYTKREDESIESYTSFEEEDTIPQFIKEGFIETDREIVRLTNGTLQFADQVNQTEEDLAKLNQAKQIKLNELKQARDVEENSIIEYNGNRYNFDIKSRERIQITRDYLILQESSASINWTTADNTEVELTSDDFIAIFILAAARSNAVHIKYKQLKDEVNDCDTIEAVEVIKWNE